LDSLFFCNRDNTEYCYTEIEYITGKNRIGSFINNLYFVKNISMKKYRLIFFFVLSLFFSSCLVKLHPVTGHLPPGQAKKISGSKSAKAYAPGQQKKF